MDGIYDVMTRDAASKPFCSVLLWGGSGDVLVLWHILFYFIGKRCFPLPSKVTLHHAICTGNDLFAAEAIKRSLEYCERNSRTSIKPFRTCSV